MKRLLADTNPLDTLWLVDIPDIYLPKLRELLAFPPTVKQKFSEIVLHEGLALKKIRPQKPADYFRRPFFSQAKREFNSSLHMLNNNISTPKVYGYGYNIVPTGEYDSFILMENVINIGSLDAFFEKEKSTHLRKKVLYNIARDIKILIKLNMYQKDCHFGNILLKNDFTICWIDNDIKRMNKIQSPSNTFKKIFLNKNLTIEEQNFLKGATSEF